LLLSKKYAAHFFEYRLRRYRTKTCLPMQSGREAAYPITDLNTINIGSKHNLFTQALHLRHKKI
jgi:hypothetical protein